MLIRCTHCGYQNNEHYRFCGMCGALLQLPEAEHASGAPGPPPRDPPAANQPQPPARNLDYLLEDEPENHGHHGRMYVALVLLLIAGVVLGWQWYRGGYSQSQPTAVTASGAPASSDKTQAGGTVASAGSPAAGESSGSQAAAPPSEPATHENVQSRAPEKLVPAPAAEPSTSHETAQPKQPDSAEKAAPQPAAEKSKAAPKTAPAKTVAPAASGPQIPPLATSAEDRLVVDGEKYLYGNGVAENCALAQKNLRAAAQRASPRAQSILGTMYATGHCVNRDLPMAYRWFAKALHGDPGNSRVQQDLEVLWKQMTPEERQLAMKTQ